MVEMDLEESDKDIFCLVLFWFNLYFARTFKNLWWYTCSQIKLYKNVLDLLYLRDMNSLVKEKYHKDFALIYIYI